MQILFTEEYCHPERLYPFTATKAVQDLRIGIFTIREKWERFLGLQSLDKLINSYKDSPHAVEIAPTMQAEESLLIHGNVIPTKRLAAAVSQLKPGEGLELPHHGVIAFRFSKTQIINKHSFTVYKLKSFKTEHIYVLDDPRQLFEWNDRCIREDFDHFIREEYTCSFNREPLGKQSVPDIHSLQNRKLTEKQQLALEGNNQFIAPENIYIEEGAIISHSIINASTGPVYIGKNAQILEGCLIRGPFALGENAILKMGAKIYGATTIGPGCIAAGEIKNSILMSFSNKAHDGYLGDSVLGSWCNLGAGTSNSNLKNTATAIKIWNRPGFDTTYSSLKCGLLMGDYSRSAINTSFNTGTIVGVGAHVFGNGLTPKFIPSFSWGAEGIKRYQFDKFVTDLRIWKEWKGKTVTAEEIAVLRHVYDKEP